MYLNNYKLGKNNLSGILPPFKPFGDDPSLVSGVNFYSGTPEKGLIAFKTPGTFSITPEESGKIAALICAGGGGAGYGAYSGGGGGGAGGIRTVEIFLTKDAATSIIVGDKGIGAVYVGSSPGTDGTNGGDSSITSIVSVGGGRGASRHFAAHSGGSGGGGSRDNSTPGSGNPNGLTPPEGYAGGTDYLDGATHNGGGGGGGDGLGQDGTSTDYGLGGIGRELYGYIYSKGGAGNKRVTGSTTDGANATEYGQGGQGGATDGVGNNKGGDGFKGIIIIRWGGYNMDYDPTDDSVS